MAWEIERTDEFTELWNGLNEDAQVSVSAIVAVLAEKARASNAPM